ncbi:MAG: hypothetical protein Q3999_00885 [Buchananella hordeovulneris]|nr:hypothetical protein [Buchananella hordeovulneris]
MDLSNRRTYRVAVALMIAACALLATVLGGLVALADEFWGAVVIVGCFLLGLILFYRMRDVHRGVRKTLFGDIVAAWNRDRDAGVPRPSWRGGTVPARGKKGAGKSDSAADADAGVGKPLNTAGMSKKAARQRAQVEAARRNRSED